jgi:hypothetical protein
MANSADALHVLLTVPASENGDNLKKNDCGLFRCGLSGDHLTVGRQIIQNFRIKINPENYSTRDFLRL